MGVRYLQRAAGRAEPGTSAKARPALPSRSPLAQVDQRLNLDAFAARFDTPPLNAPAAPPVEEDSPELFPSPAPRPETRAAADAPPTSPPPRPARVAHHQPRPESKRAESHAPADHEAARPAAPRAATRDARPAPASTSPEAETHAPAETAAPRAATRRVNSLPAPSSDEGHAPATGAARDASGAAAQGERPATAANVPDGLLDALSRAMSWVGGRESAPAGEGERRDERAPSATSAPARRPAESFPAPPRRPAPRERQPVTHLEIGRIEVEVVAPAQPARTPPPPRAARPAHGPGRAPRQPFGWRQR